MSQGRTLAHWLAKGDDGQDKDRDGITYQTTFTPPVEVARVARAGLEAREQGAKGGTLTGIARAHQLAAREPVSLQTIWRIVSFHGRHDAQADGPRREQARKLWGGAAGKAWANAIWNKHKDSVIKGGDMIKSEGMLRGLVSLGLGEDFMGLPVMGEDAEVPEWLGELLEELQDQDGDLVKGAGHKYLRRVPKAGGGWRYFYTVTGGHGLGHHSEMVRGAAFKVKDAGQEGHFHVEEDHGDEVTIKHDETGKTSRVSKKALAGMLHAEHAEAVGKVRARVTANLEQAKKTGTAKQQEKAAALVSKYGGAKEAASREEINRALKADPVAALKKYAQDMAGRTLKANFAQVVTSDERRLPYINTQEKSFIVVGAMPLGLEVVTERRKRENPFPGESFYEYENKIIPWKHLSNQAPNLDWRTPEEKDRIQVSKAAIEEKPPAHALKMSEIIAISDEIHNPEDREKLWTPIASPEDAALLASSRHVVGKAMFNVASSLRDAGSKIDYMKNPGLNRLKVGHLTLDRDNRDLAAVLAELVRTGRPGRASVEEAAQRALDLQAPPSPPPQRT